MLKENSSPKCFISLIAMLEETEQLRMLLNCVRFSVSAKMDQMMCTCEYNDLIRV